MQCWSNSQIKFQIAIHTKLVYVTRKGSKEERLSYCLVMYHTAIAVYKESGLKQSIPFIIFYLSVYITICIISTNKEDSLSQAILRMMVCKDESKVCLTPSHNFSFLQLTFTTLTMA